jgi:hypothetical protein
MPRARVRAGRRAVIVAAWLGLVATPWPAAAAPGFPVHSGMVTFEPSVGTGSALARSGVDLRVIPGPRTSLPVFGGSIGSVEAPKGVLRVAGGFRFDSAEGTVRVTALRVTFGAAERVVGRIRGRFMPIFDIVRTPRGGPEAGARGDLDYGVSTRESSARLTPGAARLLRRELGTRALRAGVQLGRLHWQAALYRATVSLRSHILRLTGVVRLLGTFTLPVEAGSLSTQGLGRVSLADALAPAAGAIDGLEVDTRPESAGVYGKVAGARVRIAAFEPPLPRRRVRAIAFSFEPVLTAEGSAALLAALEARLPITDPAPLDLARRELAPGLPFAFMTLTAPRSVEAA